jgi:hypothetical protein
VSLCIALRSTLRHKAVERAERANFRAVTTTAEGKITDSAGRLLAYDMTTCLIFKT